MDDQNIAIEVCSLLPEYTSTFIRLFAIFAFKVVAGGPSLDRRRADDAEDVIPFVCKQNANNSNHVLSSAPCFLIKRAMSSGNGSMKVGDDEPDDWLAVWIPFSNLALTQLRIGTSEYSVLDAQVNNFKSFAVFVCVR